MRERADLLEKRAAHVPGPLDDRLRSNAVKLRRYADTHDLTRITMHRDDLDKDAG